MARTSTADITPATYSYFWGDYLQQSLIRTDAEGNEVCIPIDPRNSDYAAFVSSGATAADYVAPPAPPEPTAEEKLARSGLTVDELKDLLGL